ncbi:hypothetical protein ABKA04_002064 [Annulohypoxylon sp. FPYF3050]
MATKARKISQATWNLHKETILSLYLTSDLALDKLIQVMDIDHQFSATISQFEAQLKAWDARKNLKREEWEDLLERIDYLCSQGIQSRVVISGHPVSMDRIQRARRYCKGELNPKKRRRVESDLQDTTNSSIIGNAWVEIQAQNGEWVRYASSIGVDTVEANNNDSRLDSGSTSTVEESGNVAALVYDESTSPLRHGNLSPRIFSTDISFDNQVFSTSVNQDFSSLNMTFIGLNQPPSQSFTHDYLSSSIAFPTLEVVPSPFRSFDIIPFQPSTFYLEDLPFGRFERELTSRGFKLTASPSPMQDSYLLSGAQKLAARFWQDAIPLMSKKNKKSYESNAYSAFVTLQKLETILPRAQQDCANGNTIGTSKGNSGVDLHRLLLYSAANGFAGIDDIPIETVFRFLDNNKTSSLLSRIFQENRSPVTKSLAENLFRASIDACDHQKTRFFLQTGLIDINNIFCFDRGKKMTPIERAAQLQALKVIHELLIFKPGVKKQTGLALGYLIHSRCPDNLTKREHSPFRPEYLDVVDALIKAGANITVGSIHNALLNFVDMSVAEMLLDRFEPRIHFKLMSNSYLSFIAKELSDASATKVISKLISSCEETGSGAMRGHIQLVRLLFKYAKSSTQVLSASIRSGNQELINFLLGQNIDLEQAPAERVSSEKESYPDPAEYTTPLAEAIAARDDVLIKTLENREPTFHTTKRYFIRDSVPEDMDILIFFLAIKHDNKSMLHFLLGKGANALTEGALELAAEGHPDMLRILLEHLTVSKDVIARFQSIYPAIPRSIVGEAIKRGDLDVLDIVLNCKKFDIKSMDDNCSLLEAIARDGDDSNLYFQFTKRLLDAGCDINRVIRKPNQYQMCCNMTPLLAAIITRNIHLVQLIIDRGANINQEAVFGVRQTPLQVAAEVGSLDIVELLLRNGAEVNAKAALRCGGTALQYAAASGNCNIVAILMEKGADLYGSASEFGGKWPIEAAAEKGRLDMIQFLWNMSIIGFPLDQCRKAVQLAEENGHMGCKELILQLAASSGIMPTLEG